MSRQRYPSDTPANRKRWRENWKRNHPGREAEKARRKHLRSYGLTEEQYLTMWQAQGGVCAICGNEETARHPKRPDEVKWLAVDHDHKTGKVRALLCDRCNQAIGFAQEDPARLMQMVAYLRRHTPKEIA